MLPPNPLSTENLANSFVVAWESLVSAVPSRLLSKDGLAHPSPRLTLRYVSFPGTHPVGTVLPVGKTGPICRLPLLEQVPHLLLGKLIDWYARI